MPADPPRGRRLTADRDGSVDRDDDEGDRAVVLLHPECEAFRGATLQEALARCLVWLMVEDVAGGMLA